MHSGLTTIPHCGRIEVVGPGPNNTGQRTQNGSGVAVGEVKGVISPRPVFSKRTQSAVRRAEACQVRTEASVGRTVRLHNGRQNRRKDRNENSLWVYQKYPVVRIILEFLQAKFFLFLTVAKGSSLHLRSNKQC